MADKILMHPFVGGPGVFDRCEVCDYTRRAEYSLGMMLIHPESIPDEAKVRFFRLPGGELPAEWMQRRGYLGEESERERILTKMKAKAVEVAPGVYVTTMGTGGFGMPDGTIQFWGATIAVWHN